MTQVSQIGQSLAVIASLLGQPNRQAKPPNRELSSWMQPGWLFWRGTNPPCGFSTGTSDRPTAYVAVMLFAPPAIVSASVASVSAGVVAPLPAAAAVRVGFDAVLGGVGARGLTGSERAHAAGVRRELGDSNARARSGRSRLRRNPKTRRGSAVTPPGWPCRRRSGNARRSAVFARRPRWSAGSG